jgi:site-specific DNA-methyltransferase (adenine-specific)
VTPYYADSSVQLYHGDALDLVPQLPDNSVQLLLVDPPYYRVKLDYDGEPLTWDKQWASADAYLSWLRDLAKTWQRVLTPNGSLYCFASPQMAARVEVTLSEVFQVLTHIVWTKTDPQGQAKGWSQKASKEALRQFFPQTERILFCEQYGADEADQALRARIFAPLRAYLEGERQRADIDKIACNVALGFRPIAGGMASRHYFSSSQWCLPTRKHYAALQDLFNRQGRRPLPNVHPYHPADSPLMDDPDAAYRYLPRDYNALLAHYRLLDAQYQAQRAPVHRPFQVSASVPYTDVWTFAPLMVLPGKHPAEKPLSLLRHMIRTSSRPGDTVLDCCAGSGSTLDAARACGRQAIGIELQARWCSMASSRLRQLALFPDVDECTYTAIDRSTGMHPRGFFTPRAP